LFSSEGIVKLRIRWCVGMPDCRHPFCDCC